MKTTSAIALLLMLAATGFAAPAKVDINKASIFLDKQRESEIYLRPEVKIDFRTPMSSYKARPVVEMLVLIERKESGSLELRNFYYQWDKGWTYFADDAREKVDIRKLSTEQPKCDWKKLSPETLSGRASVYYPGSKFENTPKVMAFKVRVWLEGEVLAEKETVKTSKAIPTDWETI